MQTTKVQPYEIIKLHYPIESERYHILTQHGEDVASLALEIANQYPELNLDKDLLYSAALLHDIGIYLTDAPGIDCHGTEPYIKHGYLGAELLRALGLEAHARIAERHTGTGLSWQELCSKGIELPEGIYSPETAEEEVICYADKFYSKTKLGQRKALDKVRQSLLRHGEESLARFEALHQRYGLTESN